jgi:hypothetical protein
VIWARFVVLAIVTLGAQANGSELSGSLGTALAELVGATLGSSEAAVEGSTLGDDCADALAEADLVGDELEAVQPASATMATRASAP